MAKIDQYEPLSAKQKDEIAAALIKTGGIARAVRELGGRYSRERIRNVRRERDIKLLPHEELVPHKLSKEERTKMLDFIKKNRNCMEAGKKFGISGVAAWKAAKRAGIDLTKPTPVTNEKILAALDEKQNTRMVAQELGVSVARVAWQARKHKKPLTHGGKPRVKEETRQAVREAIIKNPDRNGVAKLFGLSRSTVYKIAQDIPRPTRPEPTAAAQAIPRPHPQNTDSFQYNG